MTNSRIGRRGLGLAACVGGLLVLLARPVSGQITIADQVIARQKVVAGTTTASASPLTLGGLPGSGTILRLGAAGSVGLDVLLPADIPSVFTRRDVAEVIPSAWSFSGGTLALTNGASNTLTFSPAGVGLPTVTTRSAGTKILLFPSVSTTGYDFATGVGTSTIWTSVASSTDRFAWFASDIDVLNEPADQDLVAELTGARNFLPGMGYSGNLGMATRKWLTVSAAELWVQTLVAQDVLSTVGGRVLIGPTTVLTRDFGPTDTTIYVKHNAFQLHVVGVEIGSKLVLETAVGGVAQWEVVGVTATVAPAATPQGDYGYTVDRNLDASGANQWFAGDAVFDTGKIGSGFIDLYSMRALTNASQIGPTIVGNVRTGANYNDWAPRWAIGNLQGLYGYGASTYGSAFGNPNSTWVSIDASNGFRVMNSATTIGQWDTAGVITIGSASANQTGRVLIDSNSVDMDYRGTDGVLRNMFSIANSGTTGLMSVNATAQFNTAIYVTDIFRALSGNLTIQPTPSNSVAIGVQAGGTVRPVVDTVAALGDATHRWSNIHMNLPIQTGQAVSSSTPPANGLPYVVTGDRSDTTRLGYFCGKTVTNLTVAVHTVDCSSGYMFLSMACGLVTAYTCM